MHENRCLLFVFGEVNHRKVVCFIPNEKNTYIQSIEIIYDISLVG